MAKYNGHDSRNAWNVSIWINNDENLYNLARYCVRFSDNRREAAEMMLQDLQNSGITETPDGCPYTVTSIRKAMVGL